MVRGVWLVIRRRCVRVVAVWGNIVSVCLVRALVVVDRTAKWVGVPEAGRGCVG